MRRAIILTVACVLVLGHVRYAVSATPANAKTLARAAAVAGMQGDQDRRSELIATALDADPNNPQANWAAGRVSVNKKWVSLEDYEQQMQSHRRLAAYQLRRADWKRGKLSELQLADWCRENRLSDRERLHLRGVWQSENTPDVQRQAAARRLGLQNVGGMWLTPEEAREMRRSVEKTRQDLAAWKPQTTALIRSLESSDGDRRKLAIQRYTQSVDATAIVSIENLLSPKGESFGLVAVKALGEIADYEATESLVRHAVFATSSKVRAAATAELATRPQIDTVPPLLALLSNPLEAKFGVSVGRDGLVYRTQEILEKNRGANVRRIGVSSRGIHRVNEVPLTRTRNGGFRVAGTTDDLLVARRRFLSNQDDSPEEQFLAEMDLRRFFAAQRQRLVQQEILKSAGINRSIQMQNYRVAEVNQRAVSVLKNVTNNAIESSTPSSWWDWWNDQNDRYQAETPTYTRYIREAAEPVQYALVPPAPLSARSCECFPAGTLVRTQTGLKTIETIQSGDRVLARHTESGELGYGLVSATTIRPPSKMVTVAFSGGAIDATSGHLFWVEEHGWKMARNLKANDRIHGLQESKQVVSVSEREDAKAYNLVVDDFGTYFVGQEAILVHDNSERRRSNSITPGVAKIQR